MTGFLLAAMLLTSPTAARLPERSVAPRAFAAGSGVSLREALASAARQRPFDEWSTSHRLSQPAAVGPRQRPSRLARITAATAGALGGWFAGGTIGGLTTSKANDDTSALRGIIIGAPIGAVAGAIVGYHLVK